MKMPQYRAGIIFDPPGKLRYNFQLGMSFRPYHPDRRFAWSTLFLSLALSVTLMAADTPATNGPSTITTNAETIEKPPEKTFLQVIGSHLFKNRPPAKGPLDSLTALPAPPPPPTAEVLINPRKPSNSLDPAKSWQFAPPDQMAERYIAQEILKIKDYDPDENATGPEAETARFYRRLFHGNATTNRSNSFDGRGHDKTGDSDSSDDNGLDGRTGDKKSGLLTDMLLSAPPAAPPLGLADVLARRAPETPEEIRAKKEQQAQIDQFRKIIDYDAMSPLLSPSTPIAAMPSSGGNGTLPTTPGGMPSGGFAASPLPSMPGPNPNVGAPSLAPVLSPSSAARRSGPASLEVMPAQRKF
jgi:hypothetical protein